MCASSPSDRRNTAGFYHDPPLWVGSSPELPGGGLDFSALRGEIVHRTLSAGVAIRVTREGLFAFSFANWPPGVMPTEEGDSTPVSFDTQTTVVLHRARVMNSFLALLYTFERRAVRYSREIMLVTPELILTMNAIDSIKMGFGNGRVAHLAQSNFPSSYSLGLPPQLDDRIVFRRSGILPVEAVEAAIDGLSNTLVGVRGFGLGAGGSVLKGQQSVPRS